MHGCENGRGLGREQYVLFSLAAGQLVAILMRQYCRLSPVSPVSCRLPPVVFVFVFTLLFLCSCVIYGLSMNRGENWKWA